MLRSSLIGATLLCILFPYTTQFTNSMFLLIHSSIPQDQTSIEREVPPSISTSSFLPPFSSSFHLLHLPFIRTSSSRTFLFYPNNPSHSFAIPSTQNQRSPKRSRTAVSTSSRNLRFLPLTQCSTKRVTHSFSISREMSIAFFNLASETLRTI